MSSTLPEVSSVDRAGDSVYFFAITGIFVETEPVITIMKLTYILAIQEHFPDRSQGVAGRARTPQRQYCLAIEGGQPSSLR